MSSYLCLTFPLHITRPLRAESGDKTMICHIKSKQWRREYLHNCPTITYRARGVHILVNTSMYSVNSFSSTHIYLRLLTRCLINTCLKYRKSHMVCIFNGLWCCIVKHKDNQRQDGSTCNTTYVCRNKNEGNSLQTKTMIFL